MAHTDAQPRSALTDGTAMYAASIVEPVFTCHELAEAWKLSFDGIRNLFLNEAGVVVISTPRKREIRVYRTLKIPASVVHRVWTRLQTKKGG